MGNGVGGVVGLLLGGDVGALDGLGVGGVVGGAVGCERNEKEVNYMFVRDAKQRCKTNKNMIHV